MINFISQILNESNEAVEQSIWNLMKTVGIVGGWGLKRTKHEKFESKEGQWRFTFRIEPRGAKLKDVIANMLPAYQNTPSGRTKLLTIATGKMPADENLLAKAQKVLWKAQRPLIVALEKKLSMLDPIFHPFDFRYSGRIDSEWEMWITEKDLQKFDPSVIIPVPKPGPKPKPEVEELVAVPKHILKPEELEKVATGLIKKLGLDIKERLPSSVALKEYNWINAAARDPNDDTHLVVSDSYFNQHSKWPNIIECIVTTNREVISRSEWIQLAQGQQSYFVRPKQEDLLMMQGRKYKSRTGEGKAGRKQYAFPRKVSKAKTAGRAHRTPRVNPTTNPSRMEVPAKLRDKRKLSRKSRYGGPEAKQVRITQEKTRTYDELAVYVKREPAISSWTGKARKYGGNVTYYFFKIVPKETKIPKSEWEKKYGK